MIDMTGNVVSSTIATDKNPRELVFTKLKLSPDVTESPIRELPLFPSISRRESSATPETKDKTDQEGIAWKKPKGCRCKQSKCLKLYCDCFASGVFCSDCDCADCLNNSENYDVREAAMVNVLYRNPNAFNGNTFSSPIDKQYEAAPDTKIGLRSRGCKCKRTKCLKKYCECFQAKVPCSDNCKCINCENENVSEPSVFPWGLNNGKISESYEKLEKEMLLSNERNAIVWEDNNYVNTLGIISPNRDNVAFNSQHTTGILNHATAFSSHSSPQVYRRRRYRELPEWNSCPAPLSSIHGDSILNALGSPMSSSPKLPFRKKRSRLGYTTTPLPDLGDLCSLLLTASESATAEAGNIPVLELKSGVEDQNMIGVKPDGKEDNMCMGLSSESESRNVEEEIQSCGRLIELIDAQYTGEEDPQCKETKRSVHETDIYVEQERAVLETFRDCLHKFIEIGSIKGQFHSTSIELNLDYA